MANLYPENLYFEDAEIGTKCTAGPYLVTKNEIIQFAKQYDLVPRHIDEEAAARSVFGGADCKQRPYLLHLRFADDPASATTPCPCGFGLEWAEAAARGTPAIPEWVDVVTPASPHVGLVSLVSALDCAQSNDH